jgi:acyl-CoA dehydrogenase
VENLPFYGTFFENPGMWMAISLLAVVVVGYLGSPLILWTLLGATLMIGFGAPTWLLAAGAAVAVVFNVPLLRRMIVSGPLMKIMTPFMPKISPTERTALEAGVTWVEKDLFSGKPDFNKIMKEEVYPELTAEEKAFMAGPVEELCKKIDAWKTWKTKELEQHVWDHIKKERFLGMIIPKEYGGLGFSALAHSEVVMKVSSRSISVCITIMVPNSLGPGELLIHYGTDEQKKHYLPRLAVGDEIPCFGLTEPTAGSDAGSITSSGVVFKGQDGKLYVRLNWNKRWITLAAISTVVGLAFRLRDPDNLLGKGEDVGITCALIPAKTAGVVLGNRHDPLGVPFYNCPTHGKDVVVSIDAIVGGAEGAGRGWSMLMECLSAGRGISLPAQSVGGAKLATRVCSAHSVVRQQFGVSIGKFEGVEEPLARIFGYTYGLEAMRRFTLGAIDKGIKPGVITAMAKYYSTELGRKMINDAMDVMGGAGISMGPRNVLAEIYIAMPIGITVEGANIMTRTLIIFGQGALRAHPYAFKEVDAIEKKDLTAFDAAFWGHVGHIVRNTFRSFVLSATRGYVTYFNYSGPLKMYYRRLTWASASFAILADLAMGTLGGNLKFREKITGRFADILAWMYIATATIKRFEAEGQRDTDLAYAKYVLKHALSEIQNGFDGIFDNMYNVEQKGFGKIMFGALNFFFKEILGSWSRMFSIGSHASDHLQHVVVEGVLAGGDLRDRLTDGIYIPKSQTEQIGRLDHAMELVHKSEVIEKKVRDAVRKKVLAKQKGPALFEAAKAQNIITAEEFNLWKESAAARYDAILVDEFTQAQYHDRGQATVTPPLNRQSS